MYFWLDLWAGIPVDELKGHCIVYAEKEEINRTVILMNWYVCGQKRKRKKEKEKKRRRKEHLRYNYATKWNETSHPKSLHV